MAIAWLVQGIGHLAYHVGHLEGVDGVDRVGLVVALVIVPVFAGVALVARPLDRPASVP